MSDPRRPQRLPVDPAEMIAMVQDHAQRLAIPDWPVFGLADAGAAGWLCGSGEGENKRVLSIRIDYRPPGAAQRLIVQTQPLPVGWTPNLRPVLRRLEASDDDGEPVQLHGDGAEPSGDSSLSPADTEVIITDEPVPAVVQEDAVATAWCLTTHGVLVIVAAREVALDQVVLKRITDLAPRKRKRTLIIEQFPATQRDPPPPYLPQSDDQPR